MLKVIGHGGQPIRNFLDWKAYALPRKRTAHWKEGRSACELGRIWTRSGVPDMPEELTSLLAEQRDLRNIRWSDGFTEYETVLPFGSSGPRSHDLMVRGMNAKGNVILCVEAKADETFGDELQDQVSAAWKRSKKTQLPARLDWLGRVLFRTQVFTDDRLTTIKPDFASLRYQLLTAVSGTLLEARKQYAGTAILIVHEFKTKLTLEHKMLENASSLSYFLRVFPDGKPVLSLGEHLTAPILVGPISTPDNSDVNPPYRNSPTLYIGKLLTNCASS